jgi:hypothetical protein
VEPVPEGPSTTAPRLGRWQQVLAEALDQYLAVAVRAAVADHLGRAPTRAELNAARRAAHGLAASGRAQVRHVPGADADDSAGDRNYLVLAKPNVIMNETRLRALAVASSDAAGRKSPHDHAQTVRNLRRSLRNAAGGARLISRTGWTANRPPTSPPPSEMPWRSFSGSSAALIHASDAMGYRAYWQVNRVHRTYRFAGLHLAGARARQRSLASFLLRLPMGVKPGVAGCPGNGSDRRPQS